MELIFLGTSAGLPTRRRNVTAILLNLQHPTRADLWLFDCGEGTQHQLLRTNYHPSKLNKIFITHLHGDHLFGLLGLLCSRSMAGATAPLTVYGPPGISEFIGTMLRLSSSWTDYPLKILEINPGELFIDINYRIIVKQLNHSVICFGYRIEEYDKPGTLDVISLRADGIEPGPLFQQLKRGEIITLSNGRIINGNDYLSPSKPGKKLAIFGDTAPCTEALSLAQNVDVMVHEATLETAMEEKANKRGHSSSRQAALLAKKAEVGKLIVTHISSRYDAVGCIKLLEECRNFFPQSHLAEDFSQITI